jgi:galactose mutarotase-like enzyme
MSRVSDHFGFSVHSLVSPDGRSRADVVPQLGGTVSSLRLPGVDGQPRECLHQCGWFWRPATDLTRGGIPVLFPICGWLSGEGERGLYHARGKPCRLPIHGIAMRMPWRVVEDDSPPWELRLALEDTRHSLNLFPYSFRLALHLRLFDGGLRIELTTTNPGDVPFPYYAGFHPYFQTPAPGAEKDHVLFDVDAVARHAYNGTRTDVESVVPPPEFPRPIVGGDVNGLLLEMGPTGGTRLVFPDGFELRQTASAAFRFRQFYTEPNEPFFCDEPWMAPPGTLHHPPPERILHPRTSETASIEIAAGP